MVDQQVEEMLARGLIRPSNSPWSSPIVLAPKKDGDYRFCVDFRCLNAVTRKDAYPMPRVDEIFDKCGGARYFSTLDLASGYWKVPVNKQDIGKTAFTVGSNHYEFIIMPFGLTNVLATFQQMMTKLLHGVKGCLVFIDDIIIFADTWDEHQRILEEVLCRIQDADLKIKRSKCQFGKELVEFLGHIVSAKGIHPNPVKVQAVQNFPTPSSLSDVRAFVGMASYYRRYVRDFADIAAPLHDLTKGGQEFCWTPSAEKAFNSLKNRLSSPPILSLLNFTIPFILYTDASDLGLGAVLSKCIGSTEHVVFYASRSLTSAEKNYSTTEKECLAIVWAIHYWRPYLLGKKFKVVTDHQSFTWLQGLQEPKGRLARWILILQEYDYDIEYCPGRENSNADALSRSAIQTTAPHLPNIHDEDVVIGIRSTEVQSTWSPEKISQAQHDDPVISIVLQTRLNTAKCEGPLSDWTDNRELFHYRQVWKQLEVVDGVLHRRVTASGRKDGLVLVVPQQMRADLLRLSHNDPSFSHMGINCCLERLHPWYYWPGMASEVHLWVAECAICNQQRSSSASSRAPMDSITVLQPKELWAMDIVGPLPVTVQGHQYILVMSAHFTKWVEAVPLANQKAKTVARAFVENIVARHGVPVKLLTDQGSNFESELMKEVSRILGAHKLQTSAYHPQTNGQVEQFNRTLKTIISSYVNSNHNEWDRHLHLALFAYHTSIHSSTHTSPF